MSHRVRAIVVVQLAFCFSLVTGHSSLDTVEAARVEQREGLPVVYLEGSPYEIGKQHGELLNTSVRQSVGQLLDYFRRYPKVPLVGTWLANAWLDRSWSQARPYIPSDDLEELRGLSDGSGVPLADLRRLHAIPDRTYACSSLAVWGKATADGRLIHTRNLDWNIRAGIQRQAVVFVVRPAGKHAFVNLGWAGFIGVLSGINDQGISIGQIGAETADLSYRGLPMAFLMRRVLERSADLPGAVAVLKEGPRTVGVNYLIADAKVPQAVAVETTRHHLAVFRDDDPNERAVGYARPIADAVFRADTAIDPEIRERQFASGGDPKRRGLEPPRGSAYAIRYLKQASEISRRYGRLDAEQAKEIAALVAMDSNVQSVIFAWPDLWVANAEGVTPAARTTYHRFNARALLTPR